MLRTRAESKRATRVPAGRSRFRLMPERFKGLGYDLGEPLGGLEAG